MSLTRSFLNDFDPIFRLVQDTPNSYYGSPAQRSNQHQRQAHVEVSEEPKEYIVRAELPGVQKENLDVHVGNDGRSVTIEGHVHRTNKTAPSGAQSPQPGTSGQEVAQTSEQTGTYEYRSTFSRTVWLPHSVDGAKATAKLADGVLTLNVPKRDESGRQRISLM
ncbi:hypothetical protein FRC08_001666 [Ceratobasidium sp. 394]|nr:hypothetical protein FRC08_001666 [Ceratobasidium sp. 394]KAG9077930.1 hypothetical protein FS749_010143 [Ceratobasidium sp. UAMH 11750]